MRWLLDAMLPPGAAEELTGRGHDATTVADLGLAGEADPVIFDRAVTEGRVVVTENIADFAILLDQRLRSEAPVVPVVFVRKIDLPRRGALPHHLAVALDRWAEANPDPYLGPHWL